MPMDQHRIDTMNQMNQRATEHAESYDPRFDWSEDEWRRQFQESTNIPSRQTRDNLGRGQQGPERWEYEFNGEWLNEDQYNDPTWRRNVYNPWMQEQERAWGRQREEVNQLRGERESSRPGRGMFRQAAPSGQRGGGSIGSSSSRDFDPAMIQRLIGGG